MATCHGFGDYKSFLNDFQPVPRLQQRIDDLALDFSLGTSVTGVHVRRTDNKLASVCSPLDRFVRAMQSEVDSDPDRRFLLCTDDAEVEARLQAHFPGRVMHAVKERSRENLQGIEGALVDLFLLSRTSKVLGSYWSSFSEVSAAIGGVPLHVIRDSDRFV